MPTLPIQVLHFTCTHIQWFTLHDRDYVDDRDVDADDDRDDDDDDDDSS